jgi:hypothetical protein
MPRLVAIDEVQQIVNLAFNVNEEPSRAEIDQQLIDDWTSQYDHVILVEDDEVRAEPGDSWDGNQGVPSPYITETPSAMPVQIQGASGPVPQNDDLSILIAQEPRVGTELVMVTHNFCDPTTWFTSSVRAEEEALVDSGDGLTWNSSHPNWIDMHHGKMFDEGAHRADVEHEYAIAVTVDGVEAIQRAPFKTTGGDYEVNYAEGTVTFFESKQGSAVVATYSYATDSTWKLIPDQGSRVDIESVEAQFSSDTIMRDTIQFKIYGYNPEDPPNKILYATTNYKTMRNFIDEAQGSYPVVPAIGGSEGRGTLNAIYGFPFRYGTIRKMPSSFGLELHVRLREDLAFGGEHATATFYCTVRGDG